MPASSPTPPLLKARWPLQDAADATVFAQTVALTSIESAYGPFVAKDVPDMTMFPVSGAQRPVRVDGPAPGTYGWRFPETPYNTTWPDIGAPFASNYPESLGDGLGPTCWGFGYYPSPDLSMSIFFRRSTVNSQARAIFGIGPIYDALDGGAGKWNYQVPAVGFYFGNDGHLRVFIAGVSVFSTRSDGMDSGGTYADGQWHLATARFFYDDVNFDPTAARFAAELYVDTVLLDSWFAPPDWTLPQFGNPYTPWFLGGGKLYRDTMSTHFPSTSYDGNGNLGACGADLYDARVYCGLVSAEDIYYEVFDPPPPTVDPPLIVGSCHEPSLIRPCRATSELLRCTPNSGVRLIPSNR